MVLIVIYKRSNSSCIIWKKNKWLHRKFDFISNKYITYSESRFEFPGQTCFGEKFINSRILHRFSSQTFATLYGSCPYILSYFLLQCYKFLALLSPNYRQITIERDSFNYFHFSIKYSNFHPFLMIFFLFYSHKPQDSIGAVRVKIYWRVTEL